MLIIIEFIDSGGYPCNRTKLAITAFPPSTESDGQRVVYHAGADLAYFDVATGTNHPIEVEFYSPQVQRQRKFIDPGKFLEDYELHPEGHSTLITSRGQRFSGRGPLFPSAALLRGAID